jgi:putative RecB family exonuclease
MTVTTDQQPVPADASEAPTGPSLSPSRAADFKTCPLLFRFRTIDKVPEQPSADQARGTLVHAVLERLFDLPAADRTPEAAAALVEPEWARLVEQEPALADLFTDDTAPPPPLPAATPAPAASPPPAALPFSAPAASLPDSSLTPPSFLAQPVLSDPPPAQPMLDGMPSDETARLAAFLGSTRPLLDGYFAVEDPRRLEPAERESLVSTLVDDELLIRGYIDRLDVSPAGDLRVVDYKTGGAPREAFEGRALFQLKFYALVLWRTRGVVPRVLRLLYLKDAEICDYSPDAEELERFERTLLALSEAIERAKRERDFRPKPSRLCDWCSHQALCPAFGGTPPPYPDRDDPSTEPEITAGERTTALRLTTSPAAHAEPVTTPAALVTPPAHPAPPPHALPVTMPAAPVPPPAHPAPPAHPTAPTHPAPFRRADPAAQSRAVWRTDQPSAEPDRLG